MKLLLVEDSRLLRERLRGMIRAIPGCEIVAEADTELDARLRVDQQRPDVVVLDLRLRGGSGLSVLDYVKARLPDVIIIVLTNYGDAEYRARCLDLGADYFFDKSRDIDTFLGVLGELQLRLFAPAEEAAGATRTTIGAAEEREAT
ncbi:response regulator transcription factor [Propionivibrio dicarboxylicus]|uniref:Response regulator receiver domain-containing protein n=1 Tax=Propionivibrio dicarboxylicus TaxID=83767 RepID=A0A1G8KP27_9RHOO|nr:response regulator transcription factor [Propionivibrio dicarboxylicus]SDI45119.1 Response regulator receiver domain-containing protein [Propionivibrio dicarboxylicus]